MIHKYGAGVVGGAGGGGDLTPAQVESALFSGSGKDVDYLVNRAVGTEYAPGEFVAPHEMPQINSGNKIIWRANATNYYVLTPKNSGDGYLMIQLERGIFSSTDSVGSESELLRVVGVRDLIEVVAGYRAMSATNVTWGASVYNVSGSSGGGKHNDGNAYYSSTEVGAWAEFEVDVGANGKTNVMFNTSNGSATAVDISIDGVVIDTISLKNPSGGRYEYEIRATPGQRTIRVEKKSTGYLYLFGVNFHGLKDLQLGQPLDSIGYWYSGNNYITNKGATDYAIYGLDDGLWAGSYHGGETLVSERFVVDGASITLGVGGVAVASTFSLEQKTNIAWPGGTGFSVTTVHTFNKVAGYSLHASFAGDVNVRTFYTAMCTTPVNFNEVVFPKAHAFTGVGGDYPIGKNNVLCQRNPTTGQSIWNKFTLFNNDENNNRHPGAYISEALGSYNKLYYGPIVESPTAIYVENLAFSIEKLFD